ncbi:MAG: ATP-dependent helicase, partial [Aquificaceae bacterium]|nr:ATP-dependent helicase [Aquificaceae bacterium]
MENLLVGLSQAQERAVCLQSRYIRVIAGAGAGKTETLTRRIIYLLTTDSSLKPKNVVAFTFTEKAAQSMKDRIYIKLNEIQRRDVLQEIGDMFIGTIHSFCLRLLQEHFGYGNYMVLDDKQEVAFLFQHNRDVFNDYMRDKNLKVKIQRFLKHVNIFYDELIDKKDLEKHLSTEQRYQSFYESLKKYESLLEKHKVLTFPLMTYLAVEKLRQNSDIIETLDIKHLIVDEFQDLNKCQYELVKLIGQKANVFVVGDPRQTIYQWRGSSNEFFEEFSKDFKDVKYVLIPENRRSATSIVEYANKFSESFENTIKDPMESKREKKGVVQYYEYENPKQEAEFIAKQIKELVESGKCQYSDIAILLRS